MPQLPPVPADVAHISLISRTNASKASCGWWMLWPGLGPGDPVWARDVVTNFVTNLMSYFLGVMHSASTIRTCRLFVGGAPPFQFEEELAPNHGALTAGQAPAIAAGLYLQTDGGGRGSGSRLRVPNIGNEMTTDFVHLSDFGEQQLVFLADALAAWPAQLAPLGYGTPVIGTLQRKDAGLPLGTATFDPVQVIRPTLRLETLVRRQRSFSDIESF